MPDLSNKINNKRGQICDIFLEEYVYFSLCYYNTLIGQAVYEEIGLYKNLSDKQTNCNYIIRFSALPNEIKILVS